MRAQITIIILFLSLIVPLANVPMNKASAGNEIKIPIRWCGVDGAPSMANPALVGEATTNDVMWRRHERPTDWIFNPQAQINFRSGIFGAPPPPNLPIITDPQLAPGNPGDVRSDDNTYTEFKTFINNCRQNWQGSWPGVTGITSLHINQFVDVSGNPSTVWGLGGVPVHSSTPSQSIASRAMMVDNFYIDQACGGIWPQVDSKLVGHEFGHALSLMHGNGIDDNSNGDLDEDPTGDGAPDEPGDSLFNGNLMQYQNSCSDFAASIALTTGGTISQKGWSRDQAILHIPDIEIDPVLSPLSSMRVDKVNELRNEKYLDIDSMVVALDERKGSTSFALSTFDLLPKTLNGTLNYYFFADLDNNNKTGGSPAKLNISTRFEGAEFVGRVEVSRGDEGYTVRPTVWSFQRDEGRFVQIDDVNNIAARVLTDQVGVTPAPGSKLLRFMDAIANIIVLDVSNEVRGLVSDTIRLETLSENPVTQVRDTGDGGKFSLIAPSFPVCQVEPTAGMPGDTFVVHATDLVPESSVHVILGDKEVAKGVTDPMGTTFLKFEPPKNSTSGVRLITVGTGALTADCSMKLIPPETFMPVNSTNSTISKENTSP